MTENKVQNNEATVENVVELVKNEKAHAFAKKILADVVAIQHFSQYNKDFLDIMTEKLANKGILSKDVSLTDEQREAMRELITTVGGEARHAAEAAINKGELYSDTALKVVGNLVNICDELLAGIGAAINRGAMLDCEALVADTKSDKFNKVEIHYGKATGDITVPTYGFFISNNCIKEVKAAMNLDRKPDNKKTESKK